MMEVWSLRAYQVLWKRRIAHPYITTNRRVQERMPLTIRLDIYTHRHALRPSLRVIGILALAFLLQLLPLILSLLGGSIDNFLLQAQDARLQMSLATTLQHVVIK